MILLTIFITSSITINKKKAGILRALRTSIFDVIRIFIIESVVIGIFTFVLANVLAIIDNITNNKKIIGILKTLGIKFKELVKIFILESIILGITSLVLASLLSILGINILNKYISSQMGMYIRIIIFNKFTIVSIYIIISFTVIISIIIPLIRLRKVKPITLVK